MPFASVNIVIALKWHYEFRICNSHVKKYAECSQCISHANEVFAYVTMTKIVKLDYNRT